MKYRMQAFDLVDYLLYVYAVFSIGQNLFVTTYSNAGEVDTADLFPWPINPNIQLRILNWVLVLFIALVYARNYIVMHGIDSRNFRGSKDLCFINLNIGVFDFVERFIRFLIVFVVIVSAKKIFEPLTSMFIWIRNIIVNNTELNDHANIFSYYAVVLIVLFILFILYDLVNIFSCKKMVGNQWAEHLVSVDNNLNSFFTKGDDFIRSLFGYLNYYQLLNKTKYFHFEKYLRENYTDLISNKKWLCLYFRSPKFFERLSGIFCSLLLIICAALNFQPLPAVLAATSLGLYFKYLSKNGNIWIPIFWAIELGYLCDYFSQIRQSNKNKTNNYDYEIVSIGDKSMAIKKFWTGVFVTSLLAGAIFLYKPKLFIANNSAQKQSVVVWQTEVDEEAKAVLAKVEAEFEKRNPSVDLKIESVSWDGLSEKLNSAIRTNTLPDVSHIEPFMAYSLISKKLLSPITEFVKELDQQEGGILPAVKDLQRFDGEYYGIAYAVGTTFWVTRADKLPVGANLSKVRTWGDYLSLIRQVATQKNGAKVILPGGSPFFIDQLYAELLANTGGILFDPTSKKPLLTSTENLAVLQFFRDLAETGALSSSWPNETYLDQFKDLAIGEVFSVPVTYARASRTIQQHAKEKTNLKVGPVLFQWLKQPTSPLKNNQESIATIDCEPYVVFEVSNERTGLSGKTNKELALDFLRIFYSKNFYTQFTNSVPVHLTPIFKNMAVSDSYLQAVGIWKPWHENTLNLLNSKEKTRPILMPDIREEGRKLPFLLEFQASRILSNAVSEAILKPDKEILSIAADAQRRTEDLLESLKH